jgi:hypothetical protein
LAPPREERNSFREPSRDGRQQPGSESHEKSESSTDGI